MTNRVPFGKRGLASKQAEYLPASEPATNDTNGTAPSALALPKNVIMFLAGVSIVLVLTAFNMVGMKFLGQRLHYQFSERAAPSSVISEEEMAKLRTGVGEGSRSVFETCGIEAKKLHLPREQADRIQHHMGILSGETSLLRSASFLQCISGTNPGLYCQSGSKAFLVASIAEYFGLHQQMAEEWKFAMRETGAYKILHSLPASKAEVDALSLPSRQIDPEVTAIITRLASMGILSSSDFGGILGFGVSKPIAAALKDVDQINSICSQQQ